MTSSRAKTVFISGKFAVIHSGHIRLFMFAKTVGSKLIVALDVEGLDKTDIEWRSSFLKTQEFVDEVVVFKSDLNTLILALKPDIVIKGSEFSSQFNAENELVTSYGGELIFSSGSTYFSEQDLLNNKESATQNIENKIPRDFLKRNQIELKEIEKLIAQFKNVKVCVIGDLIIDEYINCHPLGMSREEPTVVVTPVDSQKFLGGAAIVAAHTVGLGAKTTLISTIGKDEAGTWGKVKAKDYDVELISIEDKTRPTNLKQRYRSGSQTLLKISHINQDKVTKAIQARIVQEFEKIASGINLLILSDFSYGVLTKDTTQILIDIAKRNKILIAADSQTSSQVGDLSQFANIDLITPTEIEARLELKDHTSGLAVIVENLRNRINPKAIIIKLGADGLVINGTKPNGEILALDALPSLNLNPIDVSGAGDCLLAATSLALVIENNLAKAALIGSMAAAIQIGRIGNTPIKSENLVKLLDK